MESTNELHILDYLWPIDRYDFPVDTVVSPSLYNSVYGTSLFRGFLYKPGSSKLPLNMEIDIYLTLFDYLFLTFGRFFNKLIDLFAEQCVWTIFGLWSEYLSKLPRNGYNFYQKMCSFWDLGWKIWVEIIALYGELRNWRVRYRFRVLQVHVSISAPFLSKFLGHNPVLVDLNVLRTRILIFLKLDNVYHCIEAI